MHSERTPPTEPPCETCRVEMREENAEAARVFFLVRHQVVTRRIVGSDGRPRLVVDLSLPAVKAGMDIHGVTNQRECLERVRRLFYHFEAGRQDHES